MAAAGLAGGAQEYDVFRRSAYIWINLESYGLEPFCCVCSKWGTEHADHEKHLDWYWTAARVSDLDRAQRAIRAVRDRCMKNTKPNGVEALFHLYQQSGNEEAIAAHAQAARILDIGVQLLNAPPGLWQPQAAAASLPPPGAVPHEVLLKVMDQLQACVDSIDALVARFDTLQQDHNALEVSHYALQANYEDLKKKGTAKDDELNAKIRALQELSRNSTWR